MKRADNWRRLPADGPALAQPPPNRRSPLLLCKKLISDPATILTQCCSSPTVLTLSVCVCVCVHSSGSSPCRGIIRLMKSWQAFDLVVTSTEEEEESWPQSCQRSLSQQQIPHTIKHTKSCTHGVKSQTHILEHSHPRTPHHVRGTTLYIPADAQTNR